MLGRHAGFGDDIDQPADGGGEDLRVAILRRGSRIDLRALAHGCRKLYPQPIDLARDGRSGRRDVGTVFLQKVVHGVVRGAPLGFERPLPIPVGAGEPGRAVIPFLLQRVDDIGDAVHQLGHSRDVIEPVGLLRQADQQHLG